MTEIEAEVLQAAVLSATAMAVCREIAPSGDAARAMGMEAEYLAARAIAVAAGSRLWQAAEALARERGAITEDAPAGAKGEGG